MTRSKRIKPVVDVAERREQEQARRLGAAQRELEQQRQQLDQLIQYRDEYARQFENAGNTGLSVARLQDYRVFLARLNQAIDQQRQRISQSEQACEQQRQHWLASRTRAQALDKVADRYREEENQAQERRDQTESDEFALQRHQRNKDRDRS
ncbi:flagellar export protein FliJ [Thiohalobacter thiocyanaticus]|uniref:Flagellar FliJ protein n=1 Tax=Thiohalobacter thiocyanaticus TaxID=585455 RepID=A0A426QGR4_9GAMM|nr:flagellar export protein FliJ [Thiohalobacter thiocyanaticus]RRQ20920.1 flagellar export protein FliJ [Thiohalobacter thiocyanaticus]